MRGKRSGKYLFCACRQYYSLVCSILKSETNKQFKKVVFVYLSRLWLHTKQPAGNCCESRPLRKLASICVVHCLGIIGTSGLFMIFPDSTIIIRLNWTLTLYTRLCDARELPFSIFPYTCCPVFLPCLVQFY